MADDGISVRDYTTEVKLESMKLMLFNVPQVLLQSAIQMLHSVMCLHSLPCGCIKSVNGEQKQQSLESPSSWSTFFWGQNHIGWNSFSDGNILYWKISPEQHGLLPQKSILVLKITPAEVFLICLEMIMCYLGICQLISSPMRIMLNRNIIYCFHFLI